MKLLDAKHVDDKRYAFAPAAADLQRQRLIGFSPHAKQPLGFEVFMYNGPNWIIDEYFFENVDFQFSVPGLFITALLLIMNKQYLIFLIPARGKFMIKYKFIVPIHGDKMTKYCKALPCQRLQGSVRDKLWPKHFA
jgi:hypothetical protein